jgi:hypothetical protein
MVIVLVVVLVVVLRGGRCLLFGASSRTTKMKQCLIANKSKKMHKSKLFTNEVLTKLMTQRVMSRHVPPVEEGKLPPFLLLLLKVIGLLVLPPKSNELVLMIAYIDLMFGHSRKVINKLVPCGRRWHDYIVPPPHTILQLLSFQSLLFSFIRRMDIDLQDLH